MASQETKKKLDWVELRVQDEKDRLRDERARERVENAKDRQFELEKKEIRFGNRNQK